MTPTKLLIGQALLVFAIVMAGMWAATQWAAAALGYQARLGAPWVSLFGVPVYYPWRLFEWWYAYEPYAPGLFRRAGMIAAADGLGRDPRHQGRELAAHGRPAAALLALPAVQPDRCALGALQSAARDAQGAGRNRDHASED